ncbi:50S ribosomal protein L30 [Tenacibaculum aestuariivivum]|uniref:50S ribosomal protein L30 n=1 Tax=Tenacibaculum aestuariivivum TaxID=2006131 RepID=UPI003AB2BC9C
MSKIKVTQVRSKIGRLKSQKATLEALGLRKMNQTVEHDATAPILGMVKTVSHLVSVEEIK